MVMKKRMNEFENKVSEIGRKIMVLCQLASVKDEMTLIDRELVTLKAKVPSMEK